MIPRGQPPHRCLHSTEPLTEPTLSFAHLGSIHLAVYHWGGTGPPVLLAHPTGFHGRLWEPLVQQLRNAGRTVYSFDFRGHGKSDPDLHGYSWESFAQDVLGVASHLDISGDPHLLAVGHSMGGTALLLGESRHPKTFPRLWLYEPIVFPTANADAAQRGGRTLARLARKRRATWNSVQEAFDAYSSKNPFNVFCNESLRAYVEHGLSEQDDGTWELACAPEVEAQIYEMGIGHGADSLLPRVHALSLVVYGERSTHMNSAISTRLASLLPHGRAEIMTGCGHFGPHEDPHRAADSLLAFSSSR